ncbi:MAG: sensor histidine kinase [Granulosicoccus sp.]
MKKLFLSCAAFGILFSFLAWLLSILLIDALIGREDWNYHAYETLEEIETELNQTKDLDKTLAELSSKHLVTLTNFDSDASLENLDNLEEKDTYYDIILEDGTLIEAGIDTVPPPLIAQADWLHLALQIMAILSAIWVTLIIFERQLRQLNTAAKNLEADTNNLIDAKAPNPIPTAVNALVSARQQIQKLKDAEKEAIEHHRDLLASVAHEFRNPLARLQFAMELAAERTGEEQYALFDEAHVAAEELDSLVRETLHYSRLINNGNALVLSNVSVMDAFRAVADLQPGTRPSINLQVDYPENDFYLLAEKRLLIRALTNLVTNALKYANTQVFVTLSKTNGLAQINIVDDGPGIDPSQVEKIFEPFYRIERSRSRDTGGFGLGLSIVNSICQQHNASIHLIPRSEGTHFQLVWPLAEQT